MGSIKEGHLRKWSDGKKSWNNVYCKLSYSGWFQWFENASSCSPKRSVDVRTVTKFLAFAEVVNNIPSKPVDLFGSEIPKSFAIPHEPHLHTKVSFFICSSIEEMNSWRDAISSLVHASAPPAQPQPPPYTGTAPPPPPAAYPQNAGMPSLPNVGFQLGGLNPPPVSQPYGSGAYPTQPPQPYASGAYPTQPPQPYAAGAYPTQPPQPYAAGAYPTQQPQYQVPPVYNYPVAPGPSSYPRQQGPPVVMPHGGAGQPVPGQQYHDRSGQPYQVVYVNGKPKKKYDTLAKVGLGALGGYALSRTMFGGGWGGGWGGGFGRWGSWSSFSSFSFSD